MDFLNRLLMFAVLALLIIFGVLFLLNVDSARAVGIAVEAFTVEVLGLALLCLRGSLVAGVIIGAWLLTMRTWRRRNEHLRQRDGSYALQRVRVGQATVIVDPNKFIGNAVAIGPQGLVEFMPAGVDAHLRHAIERSKVSGMQALAPGDEAISSKYGSMFSPRGLFNAATGKHLAGGWDRGDRQLPPPIDDDEPAAPVHLLTLDDAVRSAAPDRLPAGQNEAGELAIFNPKLHGHGAIVGSTGTGKTTSAAFTVATAALAAGYGLVILDPEGGADWNAFGPLADLHEADRETFPGQVDAIVEEYMRRGEQPGRPLLIVIEEYGDLIRQLRTAKRADADHVDNALDLLLRRGRKRGVHLLLVDQYPEHWSQQVIAGTKFRAVFRLGPNQGAKLEEYHAAKLPDRGAFLHNGAQYESWHAQPALRRLLATVPATPAPSIIDGTYTVRPVRSEAGEGGPTSGANTPNERPNAPAPNADPGPTDLQEIVWAWRDRNPAGSQAEMRRQLGDRGVDISKGYAHELWHRWPGAQPPAAIDLNTEAGRAWLAANAGNARLPGGERLGTDISNPH